MNWIIVPVRNGLHYTRKAMDTFLAQDIGGVQVLLINNGSTDGTTEWAHSLPPQVCHLSAQRSMSVAASWNYGLRMVFATQLPYALVVNNDVELMPDTYRFLVDSGGLFVTAVGVGSRDQLSPTRSRESRPHPDFSCFLIRREVWDRVGPFDENFTGAYAEDSDYDVRMWKAGIRGHSLGIPFLHHASGTIKSSTPKEAEEIQKQADKNRAYFKAKHCCEVGSPEYYALLGKS